MYQFCVELISDTWNMVNLKGDNFKEKKVSNKKPTYVIETIVQWKRTLHQTHIFL